MKIKPRLKEDLKKILLSKLNEESKEITLISSYLMTNNEIDEIKKTFPRLKDKRLKVEIQEDLLAGFIIKEGSKITDLSLKNYLNNIKKHIYELT